MARGILIFGPAGAGKTTLGRMVAERLNYPFLDRDNFIFKKDVEIPYSVRLSMEEQEAWLLKAMRKRSHFVLAGYMDYCSKEVSDSFDLAVHLDAPAAVRTERVHRREYAIYGDRVLEGGDLYEMHHRFLEMAASYDDDSQPHRKKHLEWAETLNCPVLYLSGEDPVDQNVRKITAAYREARNARKKKARR
ncbi:MAG: AAA family ATPase [Lachnospiraceae bacterium]|nr:AAA family ATPase [Lachnospiraceae bacterium]